MRGCREFAQVEKTVSKSTDLWRKKKPKHSQLISHNQTRKHSSRNANRTCFGGHQLSVLVGEGGPQVNKFEQVSSDGRQM